VALLEGVGDVLEEEQTEADVLVLGGVHVAAQRVGHAPQFGFIGDGGACLRAATHKQAGGLGCLRVVLSFCQGLPHETIFMGVVRGRLTTRLSGEPKASPLEPLS
jgi:hypothetical protein